MKFIVTATVQARRPDSTPADVTYYTGTSHPEALAALVSAAAKDISDSEMPWAMQTVVKSVRIDIFEEA